MALKAVSSLEDTFLASGPMIPAIPDNGRRMLRGVVYYHATPESRRFRLPILPIDTGRYGSPEMRRIFDEENKLQLWLDVEAAVAEAQAAVGDIPKIAAQEIAKNANTKVVTLARTKEIEKETRHDLSSMVQALSQACSGEGRKYGHYGLTSTDVEATPTALQFKAAFALIEKGLDQLEVTLSTMVRKYRGLIEVARTK